MVGPAEYLSVPDRRTGGFHILWYFYTDLPFAHILKIVESLRALIFPWNKIKLKTISNDESLTLVIEKVIVNWRDFTEIFSYWVEFIMT